MKSLILTLCIFLILNKINSDPIPQPDDEKVDNDKLGFPYKFDWFSGYLNGTDPEKPPNPNQKIHYVFFPSNLRSVDEAPVVLWLSAVPGMACSGLQHAFQESGPVIFEFGSNKTKENMQAWNRVAHMLYFEVPPGVGFSKKDKDKVNWNDNEIANATAWAIIDFFTNRFTKYKNCDLFIGGDGYGGGLALRVEDYLDAWSGGLININVEGLLLGNPCILSQECDDYTFPYKEYFYKFLYHRGLYSEDLDTQVEEHCNSFNITEMTKECKKALDTINEMIAGLNLYNYQNDCPPVPPKDPSSGENPIYITDCWDYYGPYYFFNNETVQTLLHVDKMKWEACALPSVVQYRWIDQPFEMFNDLLDRQQRVWVYAGDLDGRFPMDGTLTWIMWLRELRGLADIDPWRGWYSGDEKERQHEGSYWKMDDLVFISVHGSGHRVARDDPHAGKWILEAFIENGDLE